MARAILDASAWEILFSGMSRTLSKPTKILRAVMATRGYRAIIEKFKDERGPDGAWAKRAPSTQQTYAEINDGRRPPPPGFPRAAFNPSNRLLQLTGLLRKSLMPAALKSNTVDEGRDSILLFSPVPYSGIHDEGDPMRGIPARTFMWLDERELDESSTIALKMILGEA